MPLQFGLIVGISCGVLQCVENERKTENNTLVHPEPKYLPFPCVCLLAENSSFVCFEVLIMDNVFYYGMFDSLHLQMNCAKKSTLANPSSAGENTHKPMNQNSSCTTTCEGTARPEWDEEVADPSPVDARRRSPYSPPSRSGDGERRPPGATGAAPSVICFVSQSWLCLGESLQSCGVLMLSLRVSPRNTNLIEKSTIFCISGKCSR